MLNYQRVFGTKFLMDFPIKIPLKGAEDLTLRASGTLRILRSGDGSVVSPSENPAIETIEL